MVRDHAGEVLGGSDEGSGLLMKWKPFSSGTPYTCKDCPAYVELSADRDRWRDVAIHVAGLGETCFLQDCHYCNLASGVVQDYVRQSIRKVARGE